MYEDGGVALFSETPKPGEPRIRHCTQCLPLSEAKRRLERDDLRDPDDISVFKRRIAEAGQ
jgi:hypothetical protein